MKTRKEPINYGDFANQEALSAGANESLGSVDEESELSEHTEKCRVDQNDNVILSKNGHQFVKANGEPMVTHTEEQAEMKTSDESDQKRLKRKISRSASIIEEIEKRILPNARIEPDFKANIWASLDAAIRDFAFECATNCTRYLNNIYDEEGKLWTCTVTNVARVKNYPAHMQHIVVDLECRPEDEKVALESDLNMQCF
uniref:Uncharacterized protein n=1 Tax=Parascaris equorum TaxID=6256 RepID=A0A914RZF9_PAREQ